MLAVTLTRVCSSAPSLNGGFSASSSRSAISSGPASSESSLGDHDELIARRDGRTRRLSRTTPSSLAATARSSSSPAAWPSVSLIDLKLSRSTNSAATGVWPRRERASICSTRSRINVRFGSPVSGSWVARNASCSSALWRSDSKNSPTWISVMSRVRCNATSATDSASAGTPSSLALWCNTSAAASRQRKQRFSTSCSGATRSAAS